MPYNGAGDPSLPSDIKKMPANKRKAFVDAFNASIGKGEDYAWPVARAAAKKAGKTKKAAKDLNVGSDNDREPISQAAANYSPIGGMSGGKACANCHYFVSPERCEVVTGIIVPTGMSNLWEAAQPGEFDDGEAEPDEDDTVQPVGENKERSIVHTVVDSVKSLFAPAITVKEFGSGSNRMVFFKDTTSGQLRFIATVSNNFKDREGEIIPEEAHKEFAAWADRNGTYPELWLWHSGPKSRWGQTDALDVVDGFLVASGLVDSGKEYVANNLAAMGDIEGIGVSHGFISLKEGSTIVKYRSFELSPLLLSNAANEWTDFATIQKEGMMPFTKQKRDFLLKAGMTDAAITTFEQSLEGLSKELKSRGVDWKDYSDAPAAVDETDVWGNPIVKEVANAHKSKPADYADVPDDKFLDKTNWKYPFDEKHIKAAESYFNHEGQQKAGGYSDSQWAAMGSRLASALGDGYKYEGGKVVHSDKALEGDGTLGSKEYKALDERINTIGSKVDGIDANVKELVGRFDAAIAKLTMSDDAKTAEFFKAQVAKMPAGYQASASNGNTPAAGDKTAAQIKAAIENSSPNPNLTFFEETILGGMKVTNG